MRTRKGRVSRLQWAYFLSSFGVVLVACAVVGLLLVYSAMANLGEINRQQVSEKVRAVAENIRAQHAAMTEVSYLVATKMMYKEVYIQQNVYNEVLLLRDFTQYRSYTQIAREYFLLYDGTRQVYLSSGYTNTFDYFMAAHRIDGNAAALYGALQGFEDFTAIPASINGESAPIFAYRVYTKGRSESRGHATLGYLLSREALQAQVHQLIGELEGSMHLYWEDTYLITIQGAAEEAIPLAAYDPSQRHTLAGGATLYLGTSGDGLFRIAYVAPPGYLPGYTTIFSVVNTAYIAVAALFILGLAAFCAYSYYRPIQKLRRKYIDPQAAGGEKNELAAIESFFDDVLREKRSVEVTLQTQYTLLKRQILKLLLGGDPRYRAVADRPFMGIHLPGPLYFVAAIQPETPQDEAQIDRLEAMVEELAEGDTLYYLALSTRGDHLAVIVSLTDEGQISEATDFVETLFSEAFTYRIGISPPFGDIARLPEAFAMAMAESLPVDAAAARGPRGHGGNLFWYDEAAAVRVLQALQAQNVAEAEAAMSAFSMMAAGHIKSFAFERHAHMKLLRAIVKYAEGAGRRIDLPLVEQVAMALDRENLCRQMHAFLRTLCDADGRGSAGEAAAGSQASRRGAELVAYIQSAHADPNMSLDLLSDHFGLSNRYISTIIKEETGQSYKDYLTNLRIQKAQALLLQEGVSVTEACERVGYTHLPHFIKTFKRITGYTPSAFGSAHGQNAQ